MQADFLRQVEHYLQAQVAPHAAQLDQSSQALQMMLRQLGDRNLLALRVQTEDQDAVDDLTFRAFQEQVARYSGALAFLQTQHQSAASMLASSPNQPLQQAYLPHLGRGDMLLGVGFSHLRRRGAPSVQAEPVAGGYRVSGEVPWITGYGCFREFIVGAALPDGRALFAILPFAHTFQSAAGKIALSDPMPLAAMSSTNTVKARIHQWIVPDAYVVTIRAADWIEQQDRRNALNHGFFALGCAQAGLDILAAARGKSPSFVTEAFQALDQELVDCRDRVYQAQAAAADWSSKIQLRAWAIELAVRCTHAAVAVSRGAANYSHHPAQRVYREALAYTVFGQTTAVMEATLARLIRNREMSSTSAPLL